MPGLQPNTFKSLIQVTVNGLSYWGGYWGQRMLGATLGLMADVLSHGANQAFYARLPGHPQQAPDSLSAAGKDRGLVQFRGESQAAFAARVKNAWADYAQAGTWQQMINVLNQWGNAGWPSTWVNLTSSNLVESGSPIVFTFTITIPNGIIVPPWAPWFVGTSGFHVGDAGLYVGLGESTDIPMLLYLVGKWKPARSQGFVKIYYDATDFITFTV
jgi:hypothetical protein